MGEGDVDGARKVVCSLEHVRGFSEEKFIVPPDGRVDRDVRLKRRWSMQKRTEREQPAEGVADEDAKGFGPVFTFDLRDQFLLEEALERFASTGRGQRGSWVAVVADHRMGRGEVAAAMGVWN